MNPSDAFDYLTKGCVDVVTADALRAKLAAGQPLTVKVGFDPTAPDLHLGHTVLIRKMKHFQDLGHRVIFLIGDFTGMIGDPTGRSKTRPALSVEDIARNAETYKTQVFKILDPQKTEIRFNREWLGALGSDGLIRLAAQYNVARMLERRDFKERFEAGRPISVHEFLYPLAQAYDSVYLEADVELGGTDQLWNLNVGRDIMPGYGLGPQVVLTVPLLEGTDGVEKMSKSLNNYIGVTDTPDVMFAKCLSISDELMWRYYLLLTDLTPTEIEEERALARPMDSKLALARRLVADFHGTDAGTAAEQDWRNVHQQKRAPRDMPVLQVPASRFPWRAHDFLAEQGLAPSKSEAMRLLKARAVKRDGVVVVAGAELIGAQTFILSIGPSRFYRVEPVPEESEKT
ncbi:MAG: tyrosine--tRNA ligase [Vicinamibacteria bacterium]